MKSPSRRIITVVFLILLMAFVALPIYWMFITSIKPNSAAFNIPPQMFPKHPTFANYISQLTDLTGFVTYFKNSVIVSLGSTVISIVVAVFAGYAFSRFRFPLKRILFIAILASQMFPGSLMIVGMYAFFHNVHLLNTYIGLILAFTSFSLPFATWMMLGFFNTVPRDLEESSEIDGSSRFGTLFRVILPLTAPGIVAVGVYSFLNAWNNLLFSLSLTSSQGMRTVPPGFLMTYVGEFQYYWSDAMAGSIIVILPMVVVFILLQKYIVQGMTAGAIKG